MRTFLVTGGAGFIGSHIAEALVARGDRVRVLDNLSHRPPSATSSTSRARSNSSRATSPTPTVVAKAVKGRRLRVSRGGAGLGAAQRRAAARHPRGLRHRHADRARRGPQGGRAAAGLCRLEQRLRRSADLVEARDRSAGADFALRRRQAGRRVLLPGVYGHLRLRDRLRSATSTSSARGRIRTASTRP